MEDRHTFVQSRRRTRIRSVSRVVIAVYAIGAAALINYGGNKVRPLSLLGLMTTTYVFNRKSKWQRSTTDN